MTELATYPLAVLRETVDCCRLTAVRHTVSGYAIACGLRAPRLYDFVVAVSELMANVVRHGGGRGEVEVHLADQFLTCVVSDRGPGIPVGFLRERAAPAPHLSSGRGLWVIRTVCDAMETTTSPHGTTVRVRVAVPFVADDGSWQFPRFRPSRHEHLPAPMPVLETAGERELW
jgi:serine/threonine-protein kinase RsbW